MTLMVVLWPPQPHAQECVNTLKHTHALIHIHTNISESDLKITVVFIL